jgi:GGDEF domain-containing protein
MFPSAAPEVTPMSATTLRTPRLRSVTVPLSPAERLAELPGPAHLQTRFVQVQEICARLGVPATAVVIRLEGLARLREEVGVAAPVEALAAAAGAIAAHVRQGDELGRWSDDELAVLCPGADPDAVTQLAHRLVAAIETVRVRHFLQDDVEITLPLRATPRIVAAAPVEAPRLQVA